MLISGPPKRRADAANLPDHGSGERRKKPAPPAPAPAMQRPRPEEDFTEAPPAKAAGAGGSAAAPAPEWRCDVCAKVATSKAGLEDHFRGKKHKSKVAASRNSSQQAPAAAAGPVEPPAWPPEDDDDGQPLPAVAEEEYHYGSVNIPQMGQDEDDEQQYDQRGGVGQEYYGSGQKSEQQQQQQLPELPEDSPTTITMDINGESYSILKMQNILLCELCNARAHDKCTMELHLTSKKHKTRAKYAAAEAAAGNNAGAGTNRKGPKHEEEAAPPPPATVPVAKDGSRKVKLYVDGVLHVVRRLKDNSVLCGQCNVRCGEVFGMTVHLAGKEHRKQPATVPEEEEDGDEDVVAAEQYASD